MMDETCNGYTNYKTWSVALFIQNDEFLYNCAKNCRGNYAQFRHMMEDLNRPYTPDGVDWYDDEINLSEIKDMMEEL